MTKADSESLYMNELRDIDARKKAGLEPGEVMIMQIMAGLDRYKRDVAIDDRKDVLRCNACGQFMYK